uniref:Uncharacterized protein n=1 Tax=Cannabis sativa TaxID=3483 RepID=A0A803QHX9_CANSA
MKSLLRIKDVQILIGRITVLSRFVSKYTNKCFLFFNLLRGSNMGFEWTNGDKLCIYLAITKNAASAAVVDEKEGMQHPVYYIDKRLIGAESRYPPLRNWLITYHWPIEN